MCLSNSVRILRVSCSTPPVSILVLMDVPLELSIEAIVELDEFVSILVLMDVPLESSHSSQEDLDKSSFNPCFNGCASRINRKRLKANLAVSRFNPCFNGCASRIYGCI